MNNNNKGFTLVELLAVIVILAIIVIIAVPNMTNQIRQSEEETQNVLNRKIENAAHLYAAKYYANKLIGSEQVSFTLTDLQNDGLIVLNDNCDKNLNDTITVDSSGFHYDNIKSDGDTCYES